MKDWNWKDPTKEEFEKLRKKSTFYKIFNAVDKEKKALYKFWAKDYDEAGLVLEEYSKEHNGSFCMSSSLYYRDSDGNMYDDMKSMMKDFKLSKEEDRKFNVEDLKSFIKSKSYKNIDSLVSSAKKEISKLYEKIDEINEIAGIIDGFDIDKENDKSLDNVVKKMHVLENDIYELKNSVGYLKNGHAEKEWYNIDSTILECLLVNLPKLVKNANGYPHEFEDIAAKAYVPNDENESKEEKYKNISDLGFSMWKEELEKFLENVRLFDFYNRYGISYNDGVVPKSFDDKHRKEIPIISGTLDEIDYKKLNKMIEEKWNFICCWYKKYGRSLWD